MRAGRGNIGHPFGLPDGYVYSAKRGFHAVRQRIAAPAENDLAGVAVADGRLDSSGHVALRRHHVEERQPGVVDRAGELN